MRTRRRIAAAVTLIAFLSFPACSAFQREPVFEACLRELLPLLIERDRVPIKTIRDDMPQPDGLGATVVFSTAEIDAYVQQTEQRWLKARSCLVTYANTHPDHTNADDALFAAALANIALSQADTRHVPEAQNVLWLLWERRSTLGLGPKTRRLLHKVPSVAWLLDSVEARRKATPVPESEFVARMLVAEYLKDQDTTGAERAIKRFTQEGLAAAVIEDLIRSLQQAKGEALPK